MSPKKAPVSAEKVDQIDKFKQAAREHGADEDEARWDEKLTKVVKAKPTPEKSK